MTESTTRRIDEIGDESRRRILDAAEELFAEKGFDKTSFVDISARSGISRGSIPWHFRNKDGLVMAVLERSIRRAVNREKYVEEVSAHGAAGLVTLGAVLSDFAHFLLEGNPRLLFMILTEAMSGTGPLRDQYRDFMAQQRTELQEWFRVQRPKGVDRDAATARERTLSTVMNAALLGIHLQWQIDPEGVELEECLAALASLVDGRGDELWANLPVAGKRDS